MLGRYILSCDVTDPESGEVIAESGTLCEGNLAEKVSIFLNEYPQHYDLVECGGGFFEVVLAAGHWNYGGK